MPRQATPVMFFSLQLQLSLVMRPDEMERAASMVQGDRLPRGLGEGALQPPMPATFATAGTPPQLLRCSCPASFPLSQCSCLPPALSHTDAPRDVPRCSRASAGHHAGAGPRGRPGRLSAGVAGAHGPPECPRHVGGAAAGHGRRGTHGPHGGGGGGLLHAGRPEGKREMLCGSYFMSWTTSWTACCMRGCEIDVTIDPILAELRGCRRRWVRRRRLTTRTTTTPRATRWGRRRPGETRWRCWGGWPC